MSEDDGIDAKDMKDKAEKCEDFQLHSAIKRGETK